MRRSPWMKISLPLALVAMLALFVSPVLALECCCHEAVASQAKTSAPSCCEKPAVQPVHCEKPFGQSTGAMLSQVCQCAQLDSPPFTVSGNQVFSAGAASLAAPVQPIQLVVPVAPDAPRYFESPYVRPPTPDRYHASGRAPPAFALS